MLNRPLQPRAGFDVLAPIDLRCPDQPICHGPRLRVMKAGDLVILARYGERDIECSRAEREQPELVHGPLLIVEIRECPRQRQPPRQGLPRFVNHPLGKDQRRTEAALQDHFAARSRGGADPRQRRARPFASLCDQRYRSPKIRPGSRKGDANRCIAAGGKGPIQSRSEIVDFTPIPSEIIQGGLKLPLGRERSEQRQTVFRVSPCRQPGFIAIRQFPERVRARRFQQVPPGFRLCPVQCDQRFRDEVRDTVGDRPGIPAKIMHDGGSGGEGKATRKDREATQQPLLPVRQ